MPLLTVKSSKTVDFGTIVTVTPKMAHEWIENQIVNRKLRKQAVELYLSQFQNGTWTCDPLLPLLFNSNGQLADGQHRLHAVIQHNRAVDFYVRTVSDDVLDAVCNSTPRVMRDRLQMHGVENSLECAGIGRLLMQRKLTGSVSIYQWSANRNFLPSEYVNVVDECCANWFGSAGGLGKFLSECKRIYRMQPIRSRILTARHIGYLLCQNSDVNDLLLRVCNGDVPQNESSRAIRKHLLNFTGHRQLTGWPIWVVTTTFNNGPRKLYRPADASYEDLHDSVFGRLWPQAS